MKDQQQQPNGEQTHDNLKLDYTQLAGCLFRVVDEEIGYVVYYVSYGNEVEEITPVPIRDSEVMNG